MKYSQIASRSNDVEVLRQSFQFGAETMLMSADLTVGFPQHHQPLRFRERQRREQQRIDDAEDGGVGADAQRQRDHGDRSEAWTRDEKSHAVGEVAAENRQQLRLAWRLRRRQDSCGA